MSYAIETKKRRFDRILESITDSASAAASSRNSLGKRRRLSPSTSATATTSLINHYLPSSRAAFLDRLETFRHVTKWHIPSTEKVNASVWAKRGWICGDSRSSSGGDDDSDTVFCGACKQRLHVDLDARSNKDVAAAAAEQQQQQQQQQEGDEVEKPTEEESLALSRDIHEALVKKYQDLVVEAHEQRCPWRNRGCDGSIQRIEGLLNTDTALQGVRTRYESLVPSMIHQVPALEPLPGVGEAVLADLRFRNDGDGEKEGEEKEEEDHVNVNLDLLRLAICGWQKKTDDVVECRHCFRSLGLWLYRAQPPVIDQLDPIESHLEYCPWRSAEAQDTELTVYQEDRSLGETKRKYAGWELVYQATVKDSVRKRPRTATASTTTPLTPRQTPAPAPAPTPTLTTATTTTPGIGSGSPSCSPISDTLTNEQQQEKKRLDLLRRVRELKKPFTMKPLLLGKRKKQQQQRSMQAS